MNPSQTSNAYSDLLGAGSDSALERLVFDLAKIYGAGSAPVAVRKSLDSSLIAAVSVRGRLSSERAVRPRFHFKSAALIAAAAAVVIVAVVGYAVAPLVDQLLANERGAATLPMQNIGQAQTTNGVTVKLERAYADVNRILVAYTIQVPAGFAESSSGLDRKISLTDAQGLTFPVIDAQGLDGNSVGGAVPNLTEQSHLIADLVTFDAESLAPGTTDLTLRLTLPDVRAKAENPSASELKAGSFGFTFNLPVAPGRVVTVNQTLVASGVPVTLERVVITPSETRAYLRFPASAGIIDSEWIADAHISGVGWDSRQLPAAFSGLMTLGDSFMNSRGEHVETFSGDFQSRHGEWTFTVDALSGVVPTATNTQAQVDGPWTFRFSLS